MPLNDSALPDGCSASQAAITLLLHRWIVSGQMQRLRMTASDWGRAVGLALFTVGGCRYPTLGGGRGDRHRPVADSPADTRTPGARRPSQPPSCHAGTLTRRSGACSVSDSAHSKGEWLQLLLIANQSIDMWPWNVAVNQILAPLSPIHPPPTARALGRESSELGPSAHPGHQQAPSGRS